jgi:hypothetical protein
MKATFLVVAFLAAAAGLRSADDSQPVKRPDVWAPLRVFVGEWEGESQGEPGKGQSTRTYAFVLNNRFIQVRNQSVYPPQEKNPKGETHQDEGYLSYDRGAKKFILRQFHGEGFVNHYVQESISEDGRTLVFVTTAIENIPPGWRGRETYRFTGNDEFTETFELAEPGKDFVLYSEARFKRRK